MSLYLGIDTSNYTTSIALSSEAEIKKNIRRLLSVKEGERGLRQSDALFAHTVALPELFADLGCAEISAIGVSDKPRDVADSYMPCFLAGVSSSSALSEVLGVPMYRFSHQAGHIAAALYSCGREDLHSSEFLAFHVSGGTTELLHVSCGKIDIVGGTDDISAGQAIDRIGVSLGLGFPCGKELEKLTHFDDVPKISRISVNECRCNLSGIENIAQRLIRDGADSAYVATYTIAFITQTLLKMAENAFKQYKDLPIICAGGVMSNKYIRSCFEDKFEAYFASPEFSCDNAAGIARLTALRSARMI